VYKFITFFFYITIFFCKSCVSLTQQNSDTTAAPLSEQYKAYRVQKKRSLYIQNFDNRTFTPQLTGRLKEKLQAVLSTSSSMYTTDDKKTADLVLYGKILGYTEEPTGFGRTSQTPAFNLYIGASIYLRAQHEISDNTDDSFSERHEVQYSTMYNTGEPFFDTRFSAEERLLEGLANRIANILYDPRIVE